MLKRLDPENVDVNNVSNSSSNDSITYLNTFIQRKRLRLESDETESPLKTKSACTVKSEFYFYEKGGEKY